MYNTTDSKYRSEVIERFINIEWLLNAIITQHYFKRMVSSFLFEVLYDEYFNFGLKRRIIEKIIPNINEAPWDVLQIISFSCLCRGLGVKS